MNGPRSSRCLLAELAAGRALYALEPGEEAIARAHYPQCSKYSSIVRETADSAALLAFTFDQYDRRPVWSDGRGWPRALTP